MRWDLLILFLAVSLLYVACLLIVLVWDATVWQESQRIGASVVMSLVFLGFGTHFYLSHFTNRK